MDFIAHDVVTMGPDVKLLNNLALCVLLSSLYAKSMLTVKG